jgi:hypothetical protein
MSKIRTVEELRDHMLEMLDKLDKGLIEVHEVGVAGKLCESVIATIRVQMDYAKMLGLEPTMQIAFVNDRPSLIDVSSKQGLLERRKEMVEKRKAERINHMKRD